MGEVERRLTVAGGVLETTTGDSEAFQGNFLIEQMDFGHDGSTMNDKPILNLGKDFRVKKFSWFLRGKTVYNVISHF